MDTEPALNSDLAQINRQTPRGSRQDGWPVEFSLLHRYFNAANYLTAAQICLQDNALLRRPLAAEDIQPRVLGHWGTSPGLSLIYVHLNRLIRNTGAKMLGLAGPGHGGRPVVANLYPEGSYSEIYPQVSQDLEQLRHVIRQLSTPGGIPSHVGPATPGSIHEGGELCYSLTHATGAAMDNPEPFVACAVGDGEAETAPLAGAWKASAFLNPCRDGAILPILCLNGYKISGPTVLGRQSDEQAMALDRAYARILQIQDDARNHGSTGQSHWPAIILRTPKGGTGPAIVDGVPEEGTFRAHLLPLAGVRENPAHLAHGGPEVAPLPILPLEDYAWDIGTPGSLMHESTWPLGEMLRDIYSDTAEASRFRLFCPDETNSNRLGAVFEVTDRCLMEPAHHGDDHLSPDGQVMGVLSEHLCHGWLEGYVLTGRHGLFATYEAFAMVSASMTLQHAKWLQHARELPWRNPVPSLNILLTLTCWRNHHNGFSHQGPGLIDTVLSLSGSVIHVYLPPDSGILLAIAEHVLLSKDHVNLVVGACAGDVPTEEALAVAWLLQRHVPGLRLRGYARAIQQLLHGRRNPGRFHVRGDSEQGTTTTPFDMVVLNRMGQYHLALAALPRASGNFDVAQELTGHCHAMLKKHESYIREHLEDLPEIHDWVWTPPKNTRNAS
ncbi:phosphoketolase family protein [Arthrobacter sp. LAPM80]|uniref:phosphoketolase family protein n=1 Tax=Arthrobacter sp. LAPM80 TaxID=3141788 RepID=UPI00398BB0AD